MGGWRGERTRVWGEGEWWEREWGVGGGGEGEWGEGEWGEGERGGGKERCERESGGRALSGWHGMEGRWAWNGAPITGEHM